MEFRFLCQDDRTLDEVFKLANVAGPMILPTLFISGTLDNNTPPFQADEVRKFFKNSVHLTIENAGHEQILVNPRVQQAMVDYFSGREVSNQTIALPPLRFLPIPESKAAR